MKKFDKREMRKASGSFKLNLSFSPNILPIFNINSGLKKCGEFPCYHFYRRHLVMVFLSSTDLVCISPMKHLIKHGITLVRD